MRILAYVHKYPPVHLAGAEFMLHAMLTWMRDSGHDVRVAIPGHPRVFPSEWEGVPIEQWSTPRQHQRGFAAADVIWTHLDHTRQAVKWATRTRRPLVHLIHNDRQLTFHRVPQTGPQLLVFNSKWIGRVYREWGPKIPRVTVYPPVWRHDYMTSSAGEHVTLMNLAPAKGGLLFVELAQRMPDVRFLAVVGAYGRQVPMPDLPNLTVWGQSPATDVYEQTRVLLMPSSYESWGRCAIEAAVSGIPTVAHRTPGLTEALRDAGVILDTLEPGPWEHAIRRMLGGPGRDAVVPLARARSVELEQIAHVQLRELSTTMEDLWKR